jgi:hypothetical protein
MGRHRAVGNLQRLDECGDLFAHRHQPKGIREHIVGWPNFATVNLNLSTTYANRDVQSASGSAPMRRPAPGWDIDNIVVNGITNTPFKALVPNAADCTAAH